MLLPFHVERYAADLPAAFRGPPVGFATTPEGGRWLTKRAAVAPSPTGRPSLRHETGTGVHESSGTPEGWKAPAARCEPRESLRGRALHAVPDGSAILRSATPRRRPLPAPRRESLRGETPTCGSSIRPSTARPTATQAQSVLPATLRRCRRQAFARSRSECASPRRVAQSGADRSSPESLPRDSGQSD